MAPRNVTLRKPNGRTLVASDGHCRFLQWNVGASSALIFNDEPAHRPAFSLRNWSRGLYALRAAPDGRSEEHTSELQSRGHLVCRLLREKQKTQDQECA